MTGSLYMMRHGSTPLNASSGGVDRIRGWLDVPLDDEGRAEAFQTAEVLKKILQGRGEALHRVFSSDLLRTRRTSEILCTSLAKQQPMPQMEVTPDLRPWNMGTFEGKPTKDAITQMPYYLEHPDEPVPLGEPFNTYRNRFLDRLHIIAAMPGNNLVVTHFRGIKLAEAWDAAGRHDNDFDEGVMMSDDVPTAGLFLLKPKKGLDPVFVAKSSGKRELPPWAVQALAKGVS